MIALLAAMLWSEHEDRLWPKAAVPLTGAERKEQTFPTSTHWLAR